MNPFIKKLLSKTYLKFLLFITGVLLLAGGCFKEEPEFTTTGNNPARYEFMTSFVAFDYDSKIGYDYYTKIYDKNIDIHFPKVDSALINEQFEIKIMPISSMTLIDGKQGFRLLRAIYFEPAGHRFFSSVTVVFQIPASIDINKVYAFTCGKNGESVNYVPILKIKPDGENNLVTIASGSLCGIGIAEVDNPSFESYKSILCSKDYLSQICEITRPFGSLEEIKAAGGLTGSIANEADRIFSEWGKKIFSNDTSFKSAEEDDPYKDFRENAKALAEWGSNYQMVEDENWENTDIYKETIEFLKEEYERVTASLNQQCSATNDICVKARLFKKMNEAQVVNQRFGIEAQPSGLCDNIAEKYVSQILFNSHYIEGQYLAVHLNNTVNPNPIVTNISGNQINPDPKLSWKMYSGDIVSFDANGNMKGEHLGTDYVAACWCDDITVSDTIPVYVGKWYQGVAQLNLIYGEVDLVRAKFNLTIYFHGKPGTDKLQADWIYATLLIEDYHDFNWTQRVGYPITQVFKQNTTLTQPFFSFFKCNLNDNGTIDIYWYDTDNISILADNKGTWLDWKPLNYYPDFLWKCYIDPVSCEN